MPAILVNPDLALLRIEGRRTSGNRMRVWVVRFAIIGAWLIAPSIEAAPEPVSAAGPRARETAVQPPAWIARAGRRHALAAGTALRAGDHISTGAGGRVHIELAEHSVVKLGSSAEFDLPRLE